MIATVTMNLTRRQQHWLFYNWQGGVTQPDPLQDLITNKTTTVSLSHFLNDCCLYKLLQALLYTEHQDMTGLLTMARIVL